MSMNSVPEPLAGQVVVVTGAGSGIGFAIAQRCLYEGASVLGIGRSADRLAGLKSAASSMGLSSRLAVFEADIREEARMQEAMEEAIDQFGVLTGVVANAGGFGSGCTGVETTLAEWNEIIGVNLTGTFLTLREGARAMLMRRVNGSLIAVGSSTGVRAMSNAMAYGASKAAVHMMVKGLALELGPSCIRVNGIVPGMTETPRNLGRKEFVDKSLASLPLQSAVTVEEIGGLAAYLLGRDARHMTGSLVVMDAGRTVA